MSKCRGSVFSWDRLAEEPHAPWLQMIPSDCVSNISDFYNFVALPRETERVASLACDIACFQDAGVAFFAAL